MADLKPKVVQTFERQITELRVTGAGAFRIGWHGHETGRLDPEREKFLKSLQEFRRQIMASGDLLDEQTNSNLVSALSGMENALTAM